MSLVTHKMCFSITETSVNKCTSILVNVMYSVTYLTSKTDQR